MYVIEDSRPILDSRSTQDKVECSHCLEKFSYLTVLKKHDRSKYEVTCKQCPKTLKEKLALNMHKNTYQQ